MAARDPVPTSASILRRSTLALVAFWLLVAGALYAGFSWHEQRERAALQPYLGAGGELIIPRSPDGHFYAPGEVNHVPVRFLVDTGASSVAVSDQLAQAAMLPPGSPITVSTANGTRAARSGPVHAIFGGCVVIKKATRQGAIRGQGTNLGKAGNAGDGLFDRNPKGTCAEARHSSLCSWRRHPVWAASHA